MSQSATDHQVIAFSALAQSAKLASDIARTGIMDSQHWHVCINGLLCTEPDSINDIYQPASALSMGLDTLIKQLSDSGEGRSIEVTKYIAGIIALSRKLSGNDNALSVLSQRLDQVKRQLHHFTLHDEAVIANLASIYTEVISPLGAKIHVAGSSTHLQQPLNQNKIRALLLAGVRAAILWQQMGGKRRHLLFKRKAYISHATQQRNHF